MDKNYRMSKQTKTILALSKFKSAEQRSDYKRLMIRAEHHAATAPRASLAKVDKNAND